MKKGKTYLACVWVECPYCGGDVSGENGSLLIAVNDSGKLKCDDCGKEVSMSKTIRRDK